MKIQQFLRGRQESRKYMKGNYKGKDWREMKFRGEQVRSQVKLGNEGNSMSTMTTATMIASPSVGSSPSITHAGETAIMTLMMMEMITASWAVRAVWPVIAANGVRAVGQHATATPFPFHFVQEQQWQAQDKGDEKYPKDYFSHHSSLLKSLAHETPLASHKDSRR